MALSERLFEASTPNIFNQITVNIQRRTYSSALVDDAPAPYDIPSEELISLKQEKSSNNLIRLYRLLSVSNATLSGIQTIVKLRALYDNYELDTMTVENVTPNERQEEDEFIEKVLDTAVMRTAMTYLQQKGSELFQ